ncbi:hypothetical protein [Nocardioides sp. MH1]|uniref:hypothetical protein n=1 Tax=Nocardioides sp. MH1 TaxID=3242490 RepID=UPI0035221044
MNDDTVLPPPPPGGPGDGASHLGPPRFDPYTGQPLAPPPEAPRFDPYTGRPLAPASEAPRFDPDTGQPLSPPSTPGMPPASNGHRAPRSPRRKGLIIAGFLAAVCLLSAGGAAAVILSKPSAEDKAHDQLKADQKTCHEAVDPTLDALATVDSRLDVGLTMADYSELVGAASVERNRLDEDAVKGIDFCESAVEGIDAALFSYSLTASSWNDCIFESSCDPDTDLDLSETWADDSETMDAITQALEDGEPIDPDSDVGQRIDLVSSLDGIFEDS